MSVQTTVGLFLETAPALGQMRVLYKTTNGYDQVRAITISNVDINGNNVELSLDAVEQIRAALNDTSGSTVPLTQDQINAITKTSKPRTGNNSYYYIDVDDTFLSGLQNILPSQEQRSVTLIPYLPEPFFNNDYNALISNAENIRSSNKRFDVDRGGGFVFPTNYPAVAGIGEINISNLKFEDSNGSKVLTQTTLPWAPSSNYFMSESISDSISVPNDRAVTIKVERGPLNSAIGQAKIPVLESPPITGSYSIQHTLSLEIDDTGSFDSGNLVTQSLAVQTNINGTIDSTVTPFELSLIANVMTGSTAIPTIHARIKQTNFISYGGVYGTESTINSFLHTSENLPESLPIRFYYDTQEPYAPLAPVQDSNYTHTGHINARYNGTKTSEIDFSGIGSAVSATQFQGAAYQPTEDNAFICSQSLSDRTVEDFLFEGTEDLPTTASFFIGNVNVSDPISAANDTSVIISAGKGKSIVVGDVLLFDDTTNTEVMQVLSAEEISSPFGGVVLFQLTVTRNYDGAGLQAGFSAGTSVTLLHGTRIFKARGNRLVPVGRQKIWVKETRKIVDTNDRGFITAISPVCTV